HCRQNKNNVSFKFETMAFFVEMSAYEESIKTSERLGEKLGENETKILDMILKNKYISAKQLSESIGISTTAIENNIAKLKQKRLLKRVGPAKGGYWEVEKQ
ncbi:MAG: HTH domain-containing protein, partial [archaeon]|nr:HTH domain-containing protein [archaeon]